MRTTTSGINTALAAVITQPGYLVQLVMPTQTMYLCSLGTASTFNPAGTGIAPLWTPYDVQVSGLNWVAGAARDAQLTIGDADLTWWALAVGGTDRNGNAWSPQLPDAAVSIWQCYADAPTEALSLWSGRIGAIAKGDGVVVCALLFDANLARSPRRRVQQVVPAQYLLPAGYVLTAGGQQWTLSRKSNG